MKNDVLITIFETQLKETSNMKEKSPELIGRVVNIYALQLLNQGHVPQNFLEEILADVEAELIEIYRKKTYGFLTLEDYRRHKFPQTDDN